MGPQEAWKAAVFSLQIICRAGILGSLPFYESFESEKYLLKINLHCQYVLNTIYYRIK
jgi:hypothetical protein